MLTYYYTPLSCSLLNLSFINAFILITPTLYLKYNSSHLKPRPLGTPPVYNHAHSSSMSTSLSTRNASMISGCSGDSIYCPVTVLVSSTSTSVYLYLSASISCEPDASIFILCRYTSQWLCQFYYMYQS